MSAHSLWTATAGCAILVMHHGASRGSCLGRGSSPGVAKLQGLGLRVFTGAILRDKSVPAEMAGGKNLARGRAREGQNHGRGRQARPRPSNMRGFTPSSTSSRPRSKSSRSPAATMVAIRLKSEWVRGIDGREVLPVFKPFCANSGSQSIARIPLESTGTTTPETASRLVSRLVSMDPTVFPPQVWSLQHWTSESITTGLRALPMARKTFFRSHDAPHAAFCCQTVFTT